MGLWSTRGFNHLIGEIMSDILKIAAEILDEIKGKSGHINAIAETAVAKNKNMGMTQEDFAKKLSSALAANVKTKNPLFARVVSKRDLLGSVSYKKGVYRLKRTVKPKINHAPTEPVDTAFLGKAGEYWVFSELLFWGFNVSMMTVDKGVDIVCEKNGKYSHIQVKTATPKIDNTYGFSIKKHIFTANDNNTTYYVFVMRNGSKSTYAAIPSNYLSILVKQGIIKGDGTLSINITIDEKAKKYTLNHRDILPFINNFEVI